MGPVDFIATTIAASNGITSDAATALEGVKDAMHRINAVMAGAAEAESISRHFLRPQQRSRDRD